MKTFTLIYFAFFSVVVLTAQPVNEKILPQRMYAQEEVLDSAGAIEIYTKRMGVSGGYSITNNSSGYHLQGWHEDYYESGKLLHRGYYVDGKVITFKNYFENGQCERSIENPDPLRCLMNIYFVNGLPRKQIVYYNGRPQKIREYYETGQPKAEEDNEKDLKYLTLKKSWYENGNIQSELVLIDLKNKKYREKKYYFNGKIKEEGFTILLSGTQDYVKEGTWYCYDSDGKKRSEKHSKGIKLNSRQ